MAYMNRYKWQFAITADAWYNIIKGSGHALDAAGNYHALMQYLPLVRSKI